MRLTKLFAAIAAMLGMGASLPPGAEAAHFRRQEGNPWPTTPDVHTAPRTGRAIFGVKITSRYTYQLLKDKACRLIYPSNSVIRSSGH